MTSPDNTAASRRAILRAGLAAIGGTVAMRAEAQEKIAQAMVQYQGTPKNGQICAACAQFEAPNACKIVAGTIDPNGWCIAFAPKG